jgi:hypothetical protein
VVPVRRHVAAGLDARLRFAQLDHRPLEIGSAEVEPEMKRAHRFTIGIESGGVNIAPIVPKA